MDTVWLKSALIFLLSLLPWFLVFVPWPSSTSRISSLQRQLQRARRIKSSDEIRRYYERPETHT